MPQNRTRSRSQSGSSQPAQEESRALTLVEQRDKANEIQKSIEQRRGQFLDLVGGDERLTDRFITVAMSAVVKPGSGLLEAEPVSLLNAIRDSFQMGLEPAGPLGEGAIVAYRDRDQGGKKIAQFQPMVRGLRKLALAHPDVSVVNVGIRHRKDEFEYREGSDPFIRHVPWIDDDDPGDVMGAYAYARLRGETLVMYMNLAQIRKRRAAARTEKIWIAWEEEMMKKTVLRRFISEKLPLTTKLALALSVDEADLDRLPAPAQNPQLPAPGSRTRSRHSAADDVENGPESPQNGSGAEEGAKADAGTGAESSGAQGASEAEFTEICGAAGMSEGASCDYAKGHSGPHRSKDGAEWL